VVGLVWLLRGALNRCFVVAQTFKYFGCVVVVMRITYVDGEKERVVKEVTEDGLFVSVATDRIVFTSECERDTGMIVDLVRRVFAAEEADRAAGGGFDRRECGVPVLRIALEEGLSGGVSS